jgi:hypothetical protein
VVNANTYSPDIGNTIESPLSCTYMDMKNAAEVLAELCQSAYSCSFADLGPIGIEKVNEYVCAGWSITATWIADGHSHSYLKENTVPDLHIRIGKGVHRLTCSTPLRLPTNLEVIENVGADEYLEMSTDAVISGIASKFGKIRAFAIMGVCPLSNMEPGLSSPKPDAGPQHLRHGHRGDAGAEGTRDAFAPRRHHLEG